MDDEFAEAIHNSNEFSKRVKATIGDIEEAIRYLSDLQYTAAQTLLYFGIDWTWSDLIKFYDGWYVNVYDGRFDFQGCDS